MTAVAHIQQFGITNDDIVKLIKLKDSLLQSFIDYSNYFAGLEPYRCN